MSIITAPKQDKLPLSFVTDTQTLAPVYNEQARRTDRMFCRDYLKQWAGSFKRQGAASTINTPDFEAAAEHLAAYAYT
ncbi:MULTISPECIES: hypothetical protein [Paenarthrobacter]|uniref:Uncharacterized protein n=1 Tax=Paenarthrobacter ureafaciens TaxID=37931 RepID=A0AAX3EDR3_PAEUR|nr:MULTISPECIES: hypothetical protein [Paenarthrobacter]NKR13267.1 hypothetical protein [Arthrobacter sp. M5]NKR14883.1 hypothetical protein [Arthrobacter sp. M6]OEH62434.1 hypothetical protein A5N13_01900 [Arthrobacter sp. D4]OEH63005.1 hypothetical protein A5N17_10140 [Arthrobacter sp. D2]MDO5865185.1 hypothetical protein [Paenarthrobacter sp. SD-2]